MKPWPILTISTAWYGMFSFLRKVQTVKTVLTVADFFLPKRPNNPLNCKQQDQKVNNRLYPTLFEMVLPVI